MSERLHLASRFASCIVPRAFGADLLNAVLWFDCARQARRLALAGLAALALCGCGRIGPLEPPPNPNAPPQPAASPAEQALTPQVRPKIPPIMPPQQPFVLDPLLK